VSTEFKAAGNGVYLFGTADLADYAGHKAAFEAFHELVLAGKVKAAWALEAGGAAEAVMKMGFGNGIGFAAAEGVDLDWFVGHPGMIVAELSEDVACAKKIGVTTDDGKVTLCGESVAVDELLEINEDVLEKVYPTVTGEKGEVKPFKYEALYRMGSVVNVAKPKVLIPVFPGTNCEYDSARAVIEAGGDAEIIVLRNLTADDVSRSAERFAKAISQSQMIFLPGGFSGGDEPDGSAKFITAFFRNPAVKEQVTELLERRDGLMLGICNGFQALIKLGLVPYGKIIDTDENCPTLTYNTIGRHQSKIVRTRICSNKSPWLAGTEVGEVYNVAISHGEGRFIAPESLIKELADRGQIATQYVDLDGNPTMDTVFNPNGSYCAIEGITSPDGRVFGKMGHSERIGKNLRRDVPGKYDMQLFKSAMEYFNSCEIE